MSELNKVPTLKLENELLANERTFLAWLRTSIAVISLGFVIARFGLLTLIAAWRYHVVNRAIERGEIKSDPRLVFLVTVVVVVSAIGLIIYMTLSQSAG